MYIHILMNIHIYIYIYIVVALADLFDNWPSVAPLSSARIRACRNLEERRTAIRKQSPAHTHPRVRWCPPYASACSQGFVKGIPNTWDNK